MNYDTENSVIFASIIIINESNCNEHRVKDSRYIVRISMTAPSMHQTKPRNMPALLRTYFLMSCWLLCSSHTFQNSYINIHLLVVPIITVQAMVIRIPLPGGRSISFNQDTGVLRIQTAGDIIADMQVPDMGAIPSENVLDSITVKDTRTEKGFGAFCGEYDAEAKDNSNFSGQIPKKSFLGFYEGEIIRSREELDKIAKGRDASSGYMDYVMSLDGGVTFMDGYER